MAGNLKKSKSKKVSTRAIAEAERKQKELEEEKEKKDALQRKKKRMTSNTLEVMFPMYGLLCAILSFLFNQIGVFSPVAIILGILGCRKNAGHKDKFFYISVADVAVGILTCVLFVLYVSGIISY